MGECRYCGSTDDGRTYCSYCQRPPLADPEALVGQTLGNHQVVRYLGDGPVGMVFEATHLPSAERVRLKIVDSELVAADTELVERASQLAVASTGLHGSLPQIFEEALAQAEARMISVRWIPGRPLRELLTGTPLEPQEACWIIEALLDSLEVLHTTGLTHRDIKPENVLIAPEGAEVPVHVLDVGPSLISAQARHGAHYRSPEQARGEELIGPGTDIYSCGALLYEALSGRRPFESNDYDVLMSQISLRRAPALEQLRPDLPQALIRVVSKAMDSSPGDRYRSAAEMKSAVLEAAAVSSTAEGRVPAALASSPSSEVVASPAASPIASPAAAPAAPAEEFDLDEAPTTVRPSARESAMSQPEPMAAMEPMTESPKPSSGVKVAAVIFLLLAIIIGGGMMIYTIWAGQEREPRVENNAGLEPAEASAKAPAQPRGTVRIKLTGMPTGAVWFVDGRRLGANPFRAPRGALTHTIRVEAAGFEPYEKRLSFSEDQELAITMARIESEEVEGNFKAHTSGPGANVRRRGPVPAAPSSGSKAPAAYGDGNAPAALRDRAVTTPR